MHYNSFIVFNYFILMTNRILTYSLSTFAKRTTKIYFSQLNRVKYILTIKELYLYFYGYSE